MNKNQGGRESRPDEVGRALKELGDSSDIQYVASRYRGVTRMARHLIDHLRGELMEAQGRLKEMDKGYLDVSELNAKLAKQIDALRIAVRELTSTEPKEVPDPEEGAKKQSGLSIEIDCPNHEESFSERRGCSCGHHVEMTILREDELPPELQEVLAKIRARS